MGSCHSFTKQGIFIFGDVLDDAVLDTPFDEIQLCDRRLNFMRCTRNSIRKLFRTGKGVEKFFTVPIETRFVCTVYGEETAVSGRVRRLMLFGVIGDEPFDISQ
jgi:hypothetical protein